MARLILDISVLIAAERSTGRVADFVDDTDDVAIAALTAAELLVGVELSRSERKVGRERFFAATLDAVSVEDYDLEAARAHAWLMASHRRAGRPRGTHDLIIAATAVARDRVVVTIDQRGFADLPGVSVRATRA